MCFTFILYSQNLDKHCVGYTSFDIEIRLSKHLQNHKGFTGKAADWQIVFSEAYADKSSAYRREREIKKMEKQKENRGID